MIKFDFLNCPQIIPTQMVSQLTEGLSNLYKLMTDEKPAAMLNIVFFI